VRVSNALFISDENHGQHLDIGCVRTNKLTGLVGTSLVSIDTYVNIKRQNTEIVNA